MFYSVCFFGWGNLLVIWEKRGFSYIEGINLWVIFMLGGLVIL